MLAAFHDTFGGQANLAVLSAAGDAYHYAGNRENPVFSFRLGGIGAAGTGIYSLDRSVFRFAAPTATDRHLVPIGRTVALDAGGRPRSRDARGRASGSARPHAHRSAERRPGAVLEQQPVSPGRSGPAGILPRNHE